MEQFSILTAVMVTGIYTGDKMALSHCQALYQCQFLGLAIVLYIVG